MDFRVQPDFLFALDVDRPGGCREVTALQSAPGVPIRYWLSASRMLLRASSLLRGMSLIEVSLK